MKISRRFTNTDRDVYDSIEWTTRTSKITNADGSVVFEMNDAEIPASWSQLATDIVVSKYFRKAGVPQSNPDGTPMLDDAGNTVLGPERSVRQVVSRLSRCWRHWGERYGYFSTTEDADAFEAELAHMLLNQMAAPNSPQWFNTGLNLAYGITGPAQGHFVPDHATGEVTRAADAYTHPQPHACFIQRVSDDLVGDGGIMDLWTREARLFKYGSGTGTNFSAVRGSDEPLSGGGRSSGLMSFLKIGDRAAGAIKSGGTTRRAAKMVCLDLDHPDIEEFIDWKVREEIKVAALVEGMKNLAPEQQDVARDLGLELDYDFNGEAYYTVSGQNSNNSVRISDQFFDAVDAGGDWNLMRRTDGELSRAIPATGLWEKICFAAWKCADPGVQYDSTINAWHTCPEGGRINASNPCSEYMFLDDTACNLASINLLKFFDSETRTFDIDGYEHAIGLWTIVLEISVLMASFPSEEIARRSWKYRTLGLGYANLGAMLMQSGIPYDSDEGRAICGALTSILTGRSYTASALLAAEHGPFDGYEKNREHMLRVIRNHRRAAHGVARDSGEYEDLRISPVPIDHEEVSRANLANAEDLLRHSTSAWDDALAFGERFGYRNAQVSVIAPTGTIGLLMDCDTTGVEPDFALVKFKKLAGGGYFKIANQSLRPSLASLGYASDSIDSIVAHVMGRLDLEVEMPLPDGTRGDGISFRDFLVEHGYTGEDLVTLENVLPTVFELRFAFNAWSMPETVLRKLGLDPETARADMTFDGLAALGMTVAQRTILNRVICGTQTVEGAPGLKDSDLAVFDCANKCGPDGKRFIAPVGHIHMMAAAQPFISGAISKTINMPADASVEQIGDAYRMSWELGLKANALYRDGCKLSQPLNTTADVEQGDDVDADEALEATGANEAADAMLEASLRDAGAEARVIERVVEKIIERPMRRRLPDTRESVTHKFNVAGHEGYLIVGLYEDGSPGELFITMAKEGSTIGGLMDSLGTAISVALQYGVPVQSLVTKFAHQRFEPMGMTTNSDIPFAKSLVDYIFRWFGMQFVPGYREQNAPRRTPAATPVEVKTIVKEDEQCDTKSDTPARDRNFETGLSAGTGKTDAPSTMNPTSGGMAASPSVTSAMRPTENPGTDDPTTAPNVLDQSNASLMGDAPACDVCGSITVRNGTCYKCLNCGNSMGCS
ncbi:MAG: adenosylcobalamin-dependent ribonucleoside-diphosphate reductase [Phycisphaerales bacterium]|nr:adenosylcobalamin-dependent ribonucleoside-diphosphate reductase [Phycisphaerales bacterium]MDG1978473.1 adenosylcobalamin-dependent ribonucleoside-diphosphate reductase [Phycisphaerales bacterium]MDG2134364.1 adenosylcobalamin-dependent ribonucleoside-diphosphate reductase [Phycisphaerales bacterium]